MKSFYFFTTIVFITALTLGLKKGKKSGYTIFAFQGVIIALFTFKIFGELTHTLTVQGMGKPEVLGDRLGSFLAMALSTSVALGLFSLLFMLIKFNKKDLIPELCSVVVSGIIAFSSIQLVGTLSNLEEKYSFPSVSTQSAKLAVTIK